MHRPKPEPDEPDGADAHRVDGTANFAIVHIVPLLIHAVALSLFAALTTNDSGMARACAAIADIEVASRHAMTDESETAASVVDEGADTLPA